MNSTPCKVLLVEDDPELDEIVGAALQPDNIEVEGVRNGPTALQRTRECSYDLILVDLGLPGMSGFEVLQELKRDSATQSTPVVLLTSWQGISDKMRGFELGAADYITKPFQLVELRARIGATLRTKRLQDQLAQANREHEALHLAAEQSACAKSKTLDRLTHEIQIQMLRVLQSTDSILQANLNPEQRDAVQAIRASAASLLNFSLPSETSR